MADSFFGFDTSHADGLDDAIDCPIDDDDIIEDDEYDALNDETFGAEATAGDWEQDHEKLAQITELTRPQSQGTTNNNNKNGIDVDIEDSLSHLVLDEKDGIVPRPGVWDSPSTNSLSLTSRQPPPLSVALKNVCTVEELERGLIRPPPGLIKVPISLATTQLPPHNPPGQFILEYPQLNDHLNIRPNILNNLPPPPRFPPGLGAPTCPPSGPHQVVLPPPQPPPNVGLPNAAGLLPPNLRPLGGNQGGNIMRYTLPPHLLLPHGNPRQPMHPNFVGNFPQPPRPNILPQFLRPDHPLMPPFPNNHMNHPQQHLHHHLQQQQHSGNQRNHNRGGYQHNELATPTNHQPFFKSNQHWNQNRHNNQRYQHHHGHSMNGGGLNDNGDYDEYAGLMSTREKQWLTNIQLLQHNTNQPYFDDYYYTVFCDRANKKADNHDNQQHQHNKDKKHHNNKNGYNNRDSRDKSDQPQQVLTKVVYTPTQFENSLGKLQCGSVTAPRKIIDMDVVPNSDPQQNPPSQQKDMKKARQRLLEIERLYTTQLKLEDCNNPLAQLAEQQALQQQQQQQQQSDQEPEPKPVKKTAPELINIMLTSLLQLLHEDKLASILSIRKGKTLLLRFLPFLSVTEYANQLGEFWIGFIRGLGIIGRRDSHLLVRFFPEFHRWLETVNDFSVIIRLARGFLDSCNQMNKNNFNLTFAVNNKFGVSVIASLLEQAENLYPKDAPLAASEWSSFIVTLADIIGNSPPSVSPCQPIAANTLNEHLHRIDGLTIERYAPIESLLTDENTSR
ncbi:hypothetical protein PV327_003422 [Microctonus hyperodae]|uniref:Protein PAT1 homolog 1 n=1 Tax=Microctonus hyperodae TaxID=165561 RepID=A0AA39G4X5_MICHY|nr:hypothetical protein PV327_003422 [Microctonus hyperodae]